MTPEDLNNYIEEALMNVKNVPIEETIEKIKVINKHMEG